MKAKKLAIFFGLCLTGTTLFAEMYKENVVASFYADKFNGRRTASGEIFDTNGYTAAHKTLPFGTVLKVTNLDNGKSVNVRVNDRGPFVQGREIDVSKAAASELDMIGSGTAKVSLEIVDEEEGPVASSSAIAYGGDDDEDEDPYGSYDEDEDDYSDSSSGNTGFSFGGNAPFSTSSGSAASASYDDEEEDKAEELPSPPAPAKSETKTVKTTTTTTTTTTTVTPKAKAEEPKPKSEEPVVEETSAKRWDIQLGAYSNEGNAKVMAHKLLQAGFENVAYQKVGNIIRVVLRDIDEADLDKYQTKLDESGFSSYIVRERKNIIKKD